MALTRVLLRPRKTLGNIARESCLFRSMVLGLIVFCLPMLTGCAAEGDSKSGPPKAEPIAQVNAAGVSTVTPEGDFQSGPPETEPIAQVNAADVSTVTPEGDFQSGPPKAEPIAQVNAAGEMEDVMTVTPKGGFQNEPTEAEPTYSPI
jgi:hypothetical protein